MAEPAATESTELRSFWARATTRLRGPWFRTRTPDAGVTRSPGRLDERGEERSAALREELGALIQSWDLGLGEELRDDTSLIESGVLDSLALWNLLVWVETKIGCPVDPTSFDLPDEWDTLAGVIRFIERQ